MPVSNETTNVKTDGMGSIISNDSIEYSTTDGVLSVTSKHASVDDNNTEDNVSENIIGDTVSAMKAEGTFYESCVNTPADQMLKTLKAFWSQRMSNCIFSHININSFRHKYPFMHDLLLNNVVDYLAISKTKIDSTFPNAQFHAEGFSILWQDNTSSSGGLLIYIRSDIPHRRLSDAEVNENGIESICVELTIAKCKTVISWVYKHPKVPNDVFMQSITKITDSVLCYSSDCVLIGDMNCCPTKSNILRDFCDIYGMTNLIKDATCNKGHVPLLLDVILVTNPKRYAGTFNTECGLSDYHNIIGAGTKRHVLFLKPKKIHYRSYKNFTETDFRHDIETAPFHVVHIFDEVDDIAWFSSELLVAIINDHAPLKTKCIKKGSVPYMN